MFDTSETEETIMKLKKLFGKILGAGLCMGMLLGCMPSGALQVKAATEPNYLTFTAEEADTTNGETQAVPNSNNPVAQNTTANVKAPVMGEVTQVASVLLALLIAGEFVVILVGVSKMHKHCK